MQQRSYEVHVSRDSALSQRASRLQPRVRARHGGRADDCGRLARGCARCAAVTLWRCSAVSLDEGDVDISNNFQVILAKRTSTRIILHPCDREGGRFKKSLRQHLSRFSGLFSGFY